MLDEPCHQYCPILNPASSSNSPALRSKFFHTNLQHCSDVGWLAFLDAQHGMKSIRATAQGVLIIEGMVEAAAGNGWSGEGVTTLLLDRRGVDVSITEGVVKAAAGNGGSGKEVMTLLLERRGDEVRI